MPNGRNWEIARRKAASAWAWPSGEPDGKSTFGVYWDPKHDLPPDGRAEAGVVASARLDAVGAVAASAAPGASAKLRAGIGLRVRPLAASELLFWPHETTDLTAYRDAFANVYVGQAFEVHDDGVSTSKTRWRLIRAAKQTLGGSFRLRFAWADCGVAFMLLARRSR